MKSDKVKYWNKVAKRWEESGHVFGGGGFLGPDHLMPVFCTGLKDCNGKDIFEGDILRWHNPNENSHEDYTVEWDDEMARFQLRCVARQDVIDADFGEHSNLEVIGNIYQNPELL